MDFEILVDEHSHNGHNGHDGQIRAHRPTSPEPTAHLAVRDSEVTLCVEPVDDLRPVGGGHLHAGDVTWGWGCRATAETYPPAADGPSVNLLPDGGPSPGAVAAAARIASCRETVDGS